MQMFSLNENQVLKKDGEEEASKPIEGKMELKSLPSNLKYDFLGTFYTFSAVISSELSTEQEKRLVSMLGMYKKAFGWSLAKLQGLVP